ncbi:hypothetical protein G6F63_015482 [Rhizopus arrhizus]|nr:hypothetical protein G6F63_015482 [Rhizopus arrhizus]KAG1389944.1 hypothetical protein G6F59_015369 [Rhizopus arrhizus]
MPCRAGFPPAAGPRNGRHRCCHGCRPSPGTCRPARSTGPGHADSRAPARCGCGPAGARPAGWRPRPGPCGRHRCPCCRTSAARR